MWSEIKQLICTKMTAINKKNKMNREAWGTIKNRYEIIKQLATQNSCIASFSMGKPM